MTDVRSKRGTEQRPSPRHPPPPGPTRPEQMPPIIPSPSLPASPPPGSDLPPETEASEAAESDGGARQRRRRETGRSYLHILLRHTVCGVDLLSPPPLCEIVGTIGGASALSGIGAYGRLYSPRLADWTASARRAAALMVSLDALERAEQGDGVGRIERSYEGDGAALRLRDLSVTLDEAPRCSTTPTSRNRRAVAYPCTGPSQSGVEHWIGRRESAVGPDAVRRREAVSRVRTSLSAPPAYPFSRRRALPSLEPDSPD